MLEQSNFNLCELYKMQCGGFYHDGMLAQAGGFRQIGGFLHPGAVAQAGGAEGDGQPSTWVLVGIIGGVLTVIICIFLLALFLTRNKSDSYAY